MKVPVLSELPFLDHVQRDVGRFRQVEGHGVGVDDAVFLDLCLEVDRAIHAAGAEHAVKIGGLGREGGASQDGGGEGGKLGHGVLLIRLLCEERDAGPCRVVLLGRK